MIEVLNSLVQALRKWTSDKAKKVNGRLLWGYGYCETDRDIELIEYKHAAELLRNQELSTGICISEKEFEIIQSAIHKLLGPECKTPQLDFTRDVTNKEEWIKANPFCVAYNTWPEHLQSLCSRVGLDIKVHQHKCELIGFTPKVTEKLLCDKIEILLKVEEAKTCGVTLQLLAEEIEKCKVDIETTVLPYVCDIDLQATVTAYQCGISLDTILTAFCCASICNPTVTETEECEPSEIVPENYAIADSFPAADCTPYNCENPPPAGVQMPVIHLYIGGYPVNIFTGLGINENDIIEWTYNQIDNQQEIALSGDLGLGAGCELAEGDWAAAVVYLKSLGYLDEDVNPPYSWWASVCGCTVNITGIVDTSISNQTICYGTGPFGPIEMWIYYGTVNVTTSCGHDITIPVFKYDLAC